MRRHDPQKERLLGGTTDEENVDEYDMLRLASDDP